MGQRDSAQSRSVKPVSPRGLLALMRCRGVGGQRALRFALRWGERELLMSSSQAGELDLDRLGAGPESELKSLSALGLDSTLTRRVTPHERAQWRALIESGELTQGLEWATRELERQRAMNARVVGFFDHDYPELLRLIPRPPPLIFARGDLTPLNLSSSLTFELAIVGTRRPSPIGLERADQAARSVAARGGAVISGLALGVDRQAHHAALDVGAYTVAVLGHGLDQCYPPENEGLAEEIISAGGALLSEQPWGVTPLPRCLVARDRIQAGLSAGVWIAETSARGGALHAGRAALAQSRWLAIPRDHRDALQHLPMMRSRAEMMSERGSKLSLLHWSPELALSQLFYERCITSSAQLHESAVALKRSLDLSIKRSRHKWESPPERSSQGSLFDELE